MKTNAFAAGIAAIAVAPVFQVANGFLDAASGDSVPGNATLAVQLGLSAVFLWQWFSERKEREAVQQQFIDHLERFTPLLADAVVALEAMKSLPERNDLVVRRMELLVAELSDALHRLSD